MNPLLQETASGRHWRQATEEQRRAFCAVACTVHVDEEILLQALDILLCGPSESLAALALSDIVAMILAADGDGLESGGG